MKAPLDLCSSPMAPHMPQTTSVLPLQHQSKSYPGGGGANNHQSPLCRTPSVSSQSSLDSSASKQVNTNSNKTINIVFTRPLPKIVTYYRNLLISH